MLEKESFIDWKNDFAYNCFANEFNDTSIDELLNYLIGFVNRKDKYVTNKVIGAKPGHGKTTAIKVFSKVAMEMNSELGILIVCRERKQISEIRDFIRKGGQSYIDVCSQNYHKVKDKMGSKQIILITHERFKNMTVENTGLEFIRWRNGKRLILVDEMPPMIDAALFRLKDGFKWINDCLNAGTKSFQMEERYLIRGLINILISKELMINEGILTTPLLNHDVGDSNKRFIRKFLFVVNKNKDKIGDMKSRRKFRWFQRLCTRTESGYIDPEVNQLNHQQEKSIICSEKVNYQSLGCSIIIMDATASITNSFYKKVYEQIAMTDCTKYSRLVIQQMAIATTRFARKGLNSKTYKEVHQSITGLQKKGLYPFLLCNKDDGEKYLELGTISSKFKKYYEKDSPDSLNILNTTGKNDLSNEESLFLAALPVRPPHYYKQMAIAFHSGDKPLELIMNTSRTGGKDVWFHDPFIENIYKELLLSEIVQIIHRSNIRKLIVPENQKVNIYIATNLHHIITEVEAIYGPLGSKVIVKGKQYEQALAFEKKVEERVSIVLKSIQKNDTQLPASPRKITNGRSVEDFINRYWNKKEMEIRDVFRKFNLDIRIDINDRNRKKVYAL